MDKLKVAQTITHVNRKVSLEEAQKLVDIVEKAVSYWEGRCGLKGKIPIEIYFGIIHVESRWNAKAVSKAPAYGLMQVTPIWKGKLAMYQKDEDMFNPEKNIQSGVRIFCHYIEVAYHIQKLEDYIRSALAYYNAGVAGARQGKGWTYADAVIQASKLYRT